MSITPIVMRDFLHYYGYDDATEYGCEVIYDMWEEQKAKLLEKFRKHPNWDEDNLAIVFKEEEYEREFDHDAFEPFMDWVFRQIVAMGYTEDDKEDKPYGALCYMKYNCNSEFITEVEAEAIKAMCPSVKINVGLRITKAVGRLCKMMGLDKIVDVRPAHEGTDRTKDFGYMHYYQAFADRVLPAKYKRITVISLNPLDYWGMSFGYKWASCHTIDKWNKRGMNSDAHHYSGCYSAGTESYMLDSSSIIFYVIKEDYEGNTYYNEDKMNRVVFCINDAGSIILESRVYPDGRDGGDSSLATQFRNVMQKVIADTFDINNYWTVKKGVGACCDYVVTTSDAPHYKDYEHYGDCNVSVNKDESMEFPLIRIGHKAVCPGCGEEHYGEKNIMCYDCGGEENDEDVVFCEHCGAAIHTNRDDYVYIEGGDYYCDSDCAEAAGYVKCVDDDDWWYKEDLFFCEDDDEYHLGSYCYRDDYDDCYYSGDPYITTSDGHHYSSEYNAEEDGYEFEYFSEEWMPEDNLRWDSYEQVYFDPDNDDAIETIDGYYHASISSAEKAGYIMTDNGDWIKEDDAIIIDGNIFADEDEAEAEGYTRNEDGEFERCEVVV